MKKVLTTLVCLSILLLASSSLNAQTMSVSGSISSQLTKLHWTPNGVQTTFHDKWTGDLEGFGHTHLFSSDPLNGETGQIENIVSAIWLVTPEGNLIFDGLGSTTGPFLNVVATIRVGTVIYQGAEGQIVLNGVIGPGTVESTYTGTITFNP